MNCRPDPNGPPANSLNGSTIRGSAPPSAASTMPVRSRTTRQTSDAWRASASQRTQTPARKSRPGGVLGQLLVASVAVVALGRRTRRGPMAGSSDREWLRPRSAWRLRGCRGSRPCATSSSGRRRSRRRPGSPPRRRRRARRPSRRPCRSASTSPSTADRPRAGRRSAAARQHQHLVAVRDEAFRQRPPEKPDPPAMTIFMAAPRRFYSRHGLTAGLKPRATPAADPLPAADLLLPTTVAPVPHATVVTRDASR